MDRSEPRPPLISIIIPVRNGAELIAGCLASLAAAPGDPAREVIVVDDGSTDETAAVAARFPGRVVRGPHRGVAAARNAGIRAARGQLLLFLDADVRIRPETLRHIAAWFAAEPETAVLQGVYDPEAPAANHFFRFLLQRHYCCVHTLARGGTRVPAGNLETGCLALRRVVFESCGLFDERYRLPGGEEHELGARIAARFTISYETRFVVAHEYRNVRGTLVDMARRSFNFAMLAFRDWNRSFLRRNHVSAPPWDRAALWCLLYLPAVVAASVATDGAGRVMVLAGWGLAFFGAQAPLLSFIGNRWGVGAALRAAVFNPAILIPRCCGLVAAVASYHLLRQRERIW